MCKCNHSQVLREKKVVTLDEMIAKHAMYRPGDITAAADLGPAPDVNRWDLIKRGQPATNVQAPLGQSIHTHIEEV